MTQSHGASDDELLTKDEILQTLEDNDGKPHSLLQNQQSRNTLAQWKHNPLEYDFGYESVMETINWRGIEMRKKRFETLVDEVIDSSIVPAKPVTSEGEENIATLSASEFAKELNLDGMDDRETAMRAYDWIRENVHVRGIAEEQPSEGELLRYENGTWVPGGETTVAKSLNRLLGRHSAPTVTNMITKQYLKVEDATNVSTDDLGLDGGYIAVNNGLLNLQAGKVVRELRPEDYATTIVPWDYDPEAECPTWERFIRESVEPGKQKMIQEYAGYCLYRGEGPDALGTGPERQVCVPRYAGDNARP